MLGTGDDYVTSDDGFANVAAERQLGRVPVLLVRMNADLVMGEELKKTGAGNLFTVFGEPDIEIKDEDGELRVVLHGVDVYDPNTGEIRSNDTDQIALWMIDTAYNEESFFVRHCYFTGGQDPYARLKRALKADIDEDAWEQPVPDGVAAVPSPGDRQDRGQGDQRLRRRGDEGLRRLTVALPLGVPADGPDLAAPAPVAGVGTVVTGTYACSRFSDGRLGCGDRR